MPGGDHAWVWNGSSPIQRGGVPGRLRVVDDADLRAGDRAGGFQPAPPAAHGGRQAARHGGGGPGDAQRDDLAGLDAGPQAGDRQAAQFGGPAARKAVKNLAAQMVELGSPSAKSGASTRSGSRKRLGMHCPTASSYSPSRVARTPQLGPCSVGSGAHVRYPGVAPARRCHPDLSDDDPGIADNLGRPFLVADPRGQRGPGQLRR